MAFLTGGANSAADTGYNVANSCRFNNDDSAYMHKTPGGAGNRRTFTISVWFKTSAVAGGTNAILSTGDYSAGEGFIQINLSSSGRLTIDDYDQSGDSYNLRWTTPTGGPLIRDPSAWYNLVLAVDSTQGTQSNRAKVYLNGTNISSNFTQTTSPAENDDFHVNMAQIVQIGRSQSNNNYFDGYLAEVCVVDGSQLAPTSFGEFDEDSPTIWKPKNVSGLTFGTNGFYLDFEDSSNLGNDKNGGTDLTEVNLAATDQSTDTCTNNFATLNPLHFGTTIAASYSNLSEGNCLFTSTQDGSPYPYYFSTMAVSQGKWYAEFKRVSSTVMIGIATGVSDGFLGNNAKDYAMYEDGQTFTSGSGSSYGDALDNNDIIGVAMDLDNNKLYFSNQGVWQNSSDPESGATGTGAVSITAPASNGTGVYHFAAGDSGGGSPVIQCNFGNPIVALSSGNADANGYGNFEYAVPSGYLALCTKNLGSDGG
jgi:hypothetical protein